MIRKSENYLTFISASGFLKMKKNTMFTCPVVGGQHMVDSFLDTYAGIDATSTDKKGNTRLS